MLNTIKRIERLLKKDFISEKLENKLSEQIKSLKIRISKLEKIVKKPIIKDINKWTKHY